MSPEFVNTITTPLTVEALRDGNALIAVSPEHIEILFRETINTSNYETAFEETGEKVVIFSSQECTSDGKPSARVIEAIEEVNRYIVPAATVQENNDAQVAPSAQVVQEQKEQLSPAHTDQLFSQFFEEHKKPTQENTDLVLEYAMKAYEKKLTYFARKFLDYDTAAEAVQEAFLQFYEYFKNGEITNDSISITALLNRITYTRCIDILRRKKIIHFIPFSDLEPQRTSADGPSWIETLTDPDDPIETQVEKSDDYERLKQELKTLPHDTQVMLKLYYFEQLTHKAIAEIFKLEPSTVRARISRAIHLLRKSVGLKHDLYPPSE